VAALALLSLPLQTVFSQQYQLIQNYNVTNFFEEFRFFTNADPTGGFVEYAPFEKATSTGLISNETDIVYLGVDSTNVYTPGGLGRPSVRLESKMTFTEGLFVIDLTHMPVGCGTWPAFWTTGLGDWPADGEIDIIENVNDARTNNAALHATGNCTVSAASAQSGTWKSTDCSIIHNDNQGCGTKFTEPYNYGAEFNANGGGVYAMEWTSDTINIWFFRPGRVPKTLRYKNRVPDPAKFGTPSVSFSGPCSGSFGEKFFNHSIIIDTTFCGGWGGGTFGKGGSSCPLNEGASSTDSCVDFVARNPEAFKEAWWGIKSLKVW
ncbi:glycoside hydrolase family 16 protein, partial [Massarina eburnea CBS 473.64]